MGFNFKATKCSAVCQIHLGSLCLIFGILDRIFIYKESWRAFHTEGVIAIWTGVWFLITGIIGYYASQPKPHNQEPNKCMVDTYLGFAIVATVFAGVLLICYGVGLRYITRGRSCSDKHASYDYHCEDYPPYHCSYERRSLENKCRTSVGLGAMIIIFAIAEFGVGIWASICCCTNGCCNDCCRDTQPQQGQVVYLQTQGGPVAAYVMTQGPNGMPVAVPAMTGGSVYQPPNQAVAGQAYMMQNPQGATAVTPTQHVQGGQGYVRNPQATTAAVIPSQEGVSTAGNQPPSVKITDAFSEPSPV